MLGASNGTPLWTRIIEMSKYFTHAVEGRVGYSTDPNLYPWIVVAPTHWPLLIARDAVFTLEPCCTRFEPTRNRKRRVVCRTCGVTAMPRDYFLNGWTPEMATRMERLFESRGLGPLEATLEVQSFFDAVTNIRTTGTK